MIEQAISSRQIIYKTNYLKFLKHLETWNSLYDCQIMSICILQVSLIIPRITKYAMEKNHNRRRCILMKNLNFKMCYLLKVHIKSFQHWKIKCQHLVFGNTITISYTIICTIVFRNELSSFVYFNDKDQDKVVMIRFSW